MTIQELYTAIDGNYDSAKRILQIDRLIEKFIVRLLDDKSFEKLQQARTTMDPTSIFEAAHAMKGVLANLGLEKLSSMASVVTEEFRPGKSRKMTDEALQKQLDELEEKFTFTVDAIKKFKEAGAN
ncbi:MAG: Hpt domain-containing protein [Desulfovibrionaceae bacterium]|nr:Hpt domain-containing protein [Desulfovibrionaceae bacterium]